VDVKEVLTRITRTTGETLTNPRQDIHLDVFGEPLLLPSRAATALTLVVNELVQNALEHAFVERKSGQIEISLGQSPQELIVLVRDNGRGLPPEMKKGLGLELAEMLITDDLHGRIKFQNRPDGGTEISIRLPREIEIGD